MKTARPHGNEGNSQIQTSHRRAIRAAQVRRQLVEFAFFTGVTITALGLYYRRFDIQVVATVFLVSPILKLLASILKRRIPRGIESAR